LFDLGGGQAAACWLADPDRRPMLDGSATLSAPDAL
jgi:hypothetical protein